jgi:hypothetical protein
VVDDFDWDGETEAPEDGETTDVVLKAEPTWASEGSTPTIETPGELSGISSYAFRGGYNLDFSMGPQVATANVTDNQTGAAFGSSNFLPGWRYIRSSNAGQLNASMVRDTNNPAGSNFRFNFYVTGAANDEHYLETILDAEGDYSGAGLRWGRYDPIEFLTTASSNAFQVTLETQYLTVDGVLVGPANRETIAPSTSIVYVSNHEAVAAPPTARYLRLRLIASRVSGTGTGSIDVMQGTRRIMPRLFIPLPETQPATYRASFLRSTGGVPSAYAARFDEVFYQIGQLVGIPFVLVNVAANATTAMIPSDAAMAFGSAQARVPAFYDGYVVGIGYRWSAATTGGTFSLRATVSGANVWTAFNAVASGATNGIARQPIGTDAFSAGNGLGVEVVTSVGFTPTTSELHVMLYVIHTWDGES